MNKMICIFIISMLLNNLGVAQVKFEKHSMPKTKEGGSSSVFAADLDGDGDLDVLFSATENPNIGWYENLGSGRFSSAKTISTEAAYALYVYAADLDGDQKVDVLSASSDDDKIAWYRNLGSGNFGKQKVINEAAVLGVMGKEKDGNAVEANTVLATDLDGDGDMDVLSASRRDSKIAWYENLGKGSFGKQRVLTDEAWYASHVHAGDLDGDGDQDVLFSAVGGSYESIIAWIENKGSKKFSTPKVISKANESPLSVYAADLDGDGDLDIVTAQYEVDPQYNTDHKSKVAWYENTGKGNFGKQKVISTNVKGARSVFAADLDMDGDKDVLSASNIGLSSYSTGKFAWHQNNGKGMFTNQRTISANKNAACFICAADLDGDGDVDVLTVSRGKEQVCWYENKMKP
jgi:hypothetical protein